MSDWKPADRPDPRTVRTRQGTGPRAMVSVLLLSLLLAAIAGALLGLYYFFARPPAQTTGLAPLVALFAPPRPSRRSRRPLPADSESFRELRERAPPRFRTRSN
jgi:hypothetical protein